MKRRIRLAKMANLRDLGGYEAQNGAVTAWGRLYRSDLPADLGEQEVRQIQEMGITTVIDLRSEQERSCHPNSLQGIQGIAYCPISVFGDGRLPEGQESAADTYLEIAMGKEAMFRVFQTILQAQGAALFHCTAGKDRTGVTAALLFSLAGVSKQDIVADYILTGVYLKEKLEEFCREYPEIPLHWLMPQAEYIETFLEKMAERFPTPEEYFYELGFTEQETKRLKEKILE